MPGPVGGAGGLAGAGSGNGTSSTTADATFGGGEANVAVSLALGTLVALVSIGLLRTDHPTFEQLLQLPCYLIASALAFRPLTRWLAQRETPARKRS